MLKRKNSALALASFVLVLAAGAMAVIPNTEYSIATTNDCGRMTAAPGGGDLLGDLGYTVYLNVQDINEDPVVGIPATDMFLNHPQLATCPFPFTQADSPTDMGGYTTFSGTIHAGLVGDAGDGVDFDWALLYVYVMGIIMNDENPVCVATDSPDLSGDLAVNIVDFAKFGGDYNCTPPDCDPCHDYDYDGDNDITDFAIFGGYFNNSVCP